MFSLATDAYGSKDNQHKQLPFFWGVGGKSTILARTVLYASDFGISQGFYLFYNISIPLASRNSNKNGVIKISAKQAH